MRSPLLWAGLGAALLWGLAGLAGVEGGAQGCGIVQAGHANYDKRGFERGAKNEKIGAGHIVGGASVDPAGSGEQAEGGSRDAAQPHNNKQTCFQFGAPTFSAEWVSALAAIAGVLLLWRTVHLTRRTYNEAVAATGVARDTLWITQDIGIRQTRPYIAVTGIEALLRHQHFADGTGIPRWVIFGHVSLENSGNSPPVGLAGTATCRFLESSGRLASWVLPEWHLPRPQIGAHGQARTDFHFELDEACLTAFRSVAKDTIIEISGTIRYKSLGGEALYETRFNYFSGLRVLKDEMMAFVASEQGNDAT